MEYFFFSLGKKIQKSRIGPKVPKIFLCNFFLFLDGNGKCLSSFSYLVPFLSFWFSTFNVCLCVILTSKCREKRGNGNAECGVILRERSGEFVVLLVSGITLGHCWILQFALFSDLLEMSCDVFSFSVISFFFRFLNSFIFL